MEQTPWEVRRPDGKIVLQESGRLLIYTADGYMATNIMDSDRQESEPKPPFELVAAQSLPDPNRAPYSIYLSYCGMYMAEGNTVTHHVRFDHGQLLIESPGQRLTGVRAVKHA